MTRAALLQLSASDDPAENLAVTLEMVADAAGRSAGFVLTPEVTNCVTSSRAHQHAVLQDEAADITLAGLREAAAQRGIWILIGSLALKTDDVDGRFANRSFLIAPDGEIAARYDKIHMFDVEVSAAETYRESAGFRPGQTAVLADAGFAKIGMTICYDVRFPHLYRALAQAGAWVITVPAAFSPVTGRAHWETLLRARAIETGAYVLAPAQTGTHAQTTPAADSRPRSTHGPSLVVDPWDDALLDAGDVPDVYCVDLRIDDVCDAWCKLPSLMHDRPFGRL